MLLTRKMPVKEGRERGERTEDRGSWMMFRYDAAERARMKEIAGRSLQCAFAESLDQSCGGTLGRWLLVVLVSSKTICI